MRNYLAGGGPLRLKGSLPPLASERGWARHRREASQGEFRPCGAGGGRNFGRRGRPTFPRKGDAASLRRQSRQGLRNTLWEKKAKARQRGGTPFRTDFPPLWTPLFSTTAKWGPAGPAFGFPGEAGPPLLGIARGIWACPCGRRRAARPAAAASPNAPKKSNRSPA